MNMFLVKTVLAVAIICSICFTSSVYGADGHSANEHEHGDSLSAHHKFSESETCKGIDPEICGI